MAIAADSVSLSVSHPLSLTHTHTHTLSHTGAEFVQRSTDEKTFLLSSYLENGKRNSFWVKKSSQKIYRTFTSSVWPFIANVSLPNGRCNVSKFGDCFCTLEILDSSSSYLPLFYYKMSGKINSTGRGFKSHLDHLESRKSFRHVQVLYECSEQVWHWSPPEVIVWFKLLLSQGLSKASRLFCWHRVHWRISLS